jgi:hypothetical protein
MARFESVTQSRELVPTALTLVHQFEAGILMNWLACKEPNKATLKSGNLRDQKDNIASKKDPKNIADWKLKISRGWPQQYNPLKPNQQMALNVQAALNAEIVPLFRERLLNFDYQLK